MFSFDIQNQSIKKHVIWSMINFIWTFGIRHLTVLYSKIVDAALSLSIVDKVPSSVVVVAGIFEILLRIKAAFIARPAKCKSF